MTVNIVEPARVILPSSLWRVELAQELIRLGVGSQDADLGAVKVLQRILGRAGWPREVFQVAHQGLTDEETAALMAAGEIEGEVAES
jgi:hypothetical protein